jgi:MATE family multidrug resistance protein
MTETRDAEAAALLAPADKRGGKSSNEEPKAAAAAASLKAPTYAEEACAIWSMGWQVSVATFCRISLSTISTAFLGHLGSDELAAGALAGIWTNGVQMLILGSATSICTLCGQAYGARNLLLVGVWLQLALLFLTVLSVPVIVSFFYVDRILGAVTDDARVLSLASTFAKLVAPSVLPQGVYCALRQYLQAQEIVAPATVISIATVVVCLLTNWVCIYGCAPLGLPALGFIGSPIAQSISSTFQPVALVVYAFWYKQHHVSTWPNAPRIDLRACLQPERVRAFASLAAGMTLNFALDEWVYNVLAAIAASLGSARLAANSVLFNLWGLIFGVYWGFGLPTQVRVANFLGANAPKLAQRTLVVGFVLGGVAAAAAAVAVFVFRAPLIALFTPDPVVGGLIEDVLPIFCSAVFVSGLHIILAAVVEAMALASTLVAITLTGSWLLMLPLSYVFGIALHGGLDGLWWGSVCGETAKFLLMAGALARLDWREMARRAVQQAEADAVADAVSGDEAARLLLDRKEMQQDVALRSAMATAPVTPTVAAMLSTPRRVVHHHADKASTMEEGVSPRLRSLSYGSTS